MASKEQEVASGEEREDASSVAGAGAESDEEASADDASTMFFLQKNHIQINAMKLYL